ncbi:MAG TPA: serine/threonine-protein kinase [Thermomonospora sp.]|nr:serine/threonine-protein kinase [Thermomonospora sp.]
MRGPLPLRPSWDPDAVGPYRLVGLLGEGGQGSVYLGVRDGVQVAVKLLHPRYAASGAARDGFLREIEAARLVSDYTAEVLDVGEHHGVPYVVSEYIAGPSLAERVAADGPRHGGELIRLASGTLNGLVALHGKGIVHCDLKPENILLGPDGPRMVDFGIARALDSITPNASRQIGTPAYMAPEQIEAGTLGPYTDMFAWAATMLFAATGVHAFHPPSGNATPAAIMHRVLHHRPDTSALPPSLRDLVASALAKDHARRPTSPDALLTLLGHRPPPSVNTPRPAPVRPDKADGPGEPWKTRRSAKKPPVTITSTSLKGHDDRVTAVAFTWIDGVPFAVSGSEDGTVRLWNPRTGTALGAPFTGQGAPVLAMVCGKIDGRSAVVEGRGDGSVQVWDLDRGRPGPRLVAHQGSVRSVALGYADGLPLVVSGGADGRLLAWDLGYTYHLNAQPGVRVLSVDAGQADGRPIAVSGHADGTVRVCHLPSGRPVAQPKTVHQGRVLAVASVEVEGVPIILFGGLDGAVSAWDLRGDRLRATLTGHRSRVHALATGHLDGRPVLVSGSRDGDVRLWDLGRMQRLGDPLGHGTHVLSVALGQVEGRPVVLSGGEDGVVRVWDLSGLG